MQKHTMNEDKNTQETYKTMTCQEFEQKLKELDLNIKEFCCLIGINYNIAYQYKNNLKPIPYKIKLWLEKYQLEKEIREEEKPEELLHNKVCNTLGISRNELANLLGLSKTTIDAWSEPSRMSIATKLALELLLENHKLSTAILNLQETLNFIKTLDRTMTTTTIKKIKNKKFTNENIKPIGKLNEIKLTKEEQ